MFKKYLFILTIFLSFISIFFNSNTPSNTLYFPTKKKNYYISSYYEYRTLEYYHFHNGIDIPLVEGTPLYALSDGVVSSIGFISGYGHSVIIKYSNGYKSLYGHCSPNYIVSIGQTVKAKQKVAYVGPKYLSNGKLNGFTTGQHLHFTLYYNDKVIDPLSVEYTQY